MTGLYFYDSQVCRLVREITPSARGELEITAVNQAYLERGLLKVEISAEEQHGWTRARTILCLRPGNFVATIERRQGLKICCPEEIAYRQRLITSDQLEALASPLSHTEYGQYLLGLLKGAESI